MHTSQGRADMTIRLYALQAGRTGEPCVVLPLALPPDSGELGAFRPSCVSVCQSYTMGGLVAAVAISFRVYIW